MPSVNWQSCSVSLIVECNVMTANNFCETVISVRNSDGQVLRRTAREIAMKRLSLARINDFVSLLYFRL